MANNSGLEICLAKDTAVETVGVIVQAHENTLALSACLNSLVGQTRLPGRIYVCEDGQSENIKELIANKVWSVPITHLTQEHRGFRVSRSKNRGIAAAAEEYLILVDSDCIMHNRFVQDHLELAQPGRVILGSRIGIDGYFNEAVDFAPSCSMFLKLLVSGGIANPYHNTYNRTNSRGSVGAAKAFKSVFNGSGVRLPVGLSIPDPSASSACGNIGAWRKDLLAVNGFDEEFEGWGLEDVDLLLRLKRFGLELRKAKFRAIMWHINHPRGAGSLAEKTYQANHERTYAPNRPAMIERGISQWL